MARQRFIWPDLWTDPAFGNLTERERLLFIGLFSNADDEGRILGAPAVLRSAVFPYDDLTLEEVQRARDAIGAKCASVALYEVQNVEYIALLQWDRWQHPKYPKPSIYPPPPGKKARKPRKSHSSNVGGSLEEPSPKPDPSLGRGLGRDGLGREKDLAPAPPTRPRDEIWDALVARFGEPATKNERGRRNGVCKQLRDAGATADEIRRRAKAWDEVFPGATLTDTALMNRWSDLRPAPSVRTDTFTDRVARGEETEHPFMDEKVVTGLLEAMVKWGKP